MFQLLKTKNVIDFMRWSKFTFILSAVMVIASISSIAINQFNWGLDFTGGTLIEVTFDKPADIEVLRSQLEKDGFPDATAQHFGSTRDVVVRMRPRDGVEENIVSSQIIESLKATTDGEVQLKSVSVLGASVGAELAEAGGLAILIAMLCILMYVSMRFEWRLSAGAVLALAHDVTITLGIFSFFQIEIDLTIVAALLTVVGYSLNDTIVVFDRIRENFRKMRKSTPSEIINSSITQTLSRTLITSGTTLIVVIALFTQGGANLHGFALALLLGITVGTYSSIYVASALALKLGVDREHLMPTQVEKEGADQEAMM